MDEKEAYGYEKGFKSNPGGERHKKKSFKRFIKKWRVKTKNLQKVDSEGIVSGRTTHKYGSVFNSVSETGVVGRQEAIKQIIFDVFLFWQI